jgi:cellulose synthase/poly-beta-1,6-N-acetylglucosamine synthase-like glycosyltransferase
VRDVWLFCLSCGSSSGKRGRVMHKVAIGMPVWNGEQFVPEAIESILGQTYGDFELVISDNASTDGTAEICSAYAKQDRRIRYIRQERISGLHRITTRCFDAHRVSISNGHATTMSWPPNSFMNALG